MAASSRARADHRASLEDLLRAKAELDWAWGQLLAQAEGPLRISLTRAVYAEAVPLGQLALRLAWSLDHPADTLPSLPTEGPLLPSSRSQAQEWMRR